jgi:hypothetical protein
LVFIGIDFAGGQVKTQDKPPSPPGKDGDEEAVYTWSAVILDGPFSLKGKGGYTYSGTEGDGWLYDDSVSNINVSNGVKAVGRTKSPHLVRSYFFLEIFYPVQGESLYQVDFTENISNENAEFVDNPPPLDMNLNPGAFFKYLGFPLWGSAVADPTGRSASEIFDFLQNCDHPYSVGVSENYYIVDLHFSSTWFDNLSDGTYDNWDVDDPKPMGFGGWLAIKGQNTSDRYCDHDDDYNPWYCHNIYGDSHIRENEGWGGWPGYIVRMSENTWKVVVDGQMRLNEAYGECMTTYFNKNRTMQRVEHIEPIHADCYMNFEILFIRTLQEN